MTEPECSPLDGTMATEIETNWEVLAFQVWEGGAVAFLERLTGDLLAVVHYTVTTSGTVGCWQVFG